MSEGTTEVASEETGEKIIPGWGEWLGQKLSVVWDGTKYVAETTYEGAVYAKDATVQGAKYVAEGAVYAKDVTVQGAKYVAETTYEGAVYAKDATVQGAKDAGSVAWELGLSKGDEHAARAHQVVEARRMVKHGLTETDEFKALPDDVKVQVLENEAGLKSQGRRKDIKEEYTRQLQEWESKEGEKGERPVEPLVVRLAIGGSGDAAWRTHCDIKGAMTVADKAKLEKHTTGDAKTVYYTGTKTHDWNFAGPGASGTTGSFGGMEDRGSNSINAIVENARKVVATAVREAQAVTRSLGIKQPVVILIKGHSRGAVAAGHVANGLKEEFPDATVELTQVDPVPGPMEPERHQKVDVGSIDQSTVVYGVYSGHGVSFTPEKVLGAKRIIISQQAHGVGIQNGFKYEGRLYRGNSLNSLPAGVYRDQNPDISVAGELELVGNRDDIRKAFIDVYTKRYAPTGPTSNPAKSGQNWDADRRERIENLLEEYVKALPTEEFAEVVEKVMEQGLKGNLQ